MENSKLHVIKATPETVNWGYFDNSLEPVCTIKSGDIVYMETLTHHAGDAPEYLMDEGVKAIYDHFPIEDRAPGVHILTGPIYIEGAKPGDVLECRVLDLKPRLPYGINFQANWGLLYEEFDKTEYATLWEVDEKTATAKTVFCFKFPGVLDKPGPITQPGSVERYPVLEGVRVPVRYHLGTAGVAPKQEGKIDTVPPGVFGGNLDNRYFNVGTSMYYPVQVEGGLFTAGDAHLAQGDGEVSGTAIEAHMNATLQFFIRDDIKINNPVLETPTHWICHAVHKDLNQAMRLAALEMIDFLVDNKGLTRSEAYGLMSVAGNFAVTQVVDQLQGIHCAIPKDIFAPKEK